MSRQNSADDDRRNDDATNWIAGEQAAQRATDDDLRADGGVDQSRSVLDVDSRSELLDRVADLSHDAYDCGLSTDEIVVTLGAVQDDIISREELDRRAEELEGER